MQDMDPDEVDRAMLGGDRLGDPVKGRTATAPGVTWGKLPAIPADATLAAACQWSDPPIGGDHLVEDRSLAARLKGWWGRWRTR